jgi:hypothetical protein
MPVVRVAKAKVAGSNPVFRSNSARISSGNRGPGFFVYFAAPAKAMGSNAPPSPRVADRRRRSMDR